jgi:hypothetical protein
MSLLAIARRWELGDDERRALLADLETVARLRALAATLTPGERARLAAEATADDLAGLIWAAVAGTAGETP